MYPEYIYPSRRAIYACIYTVGNEFFIGFVPAIGYAIYLLLLTSSEEVNYSVIAPTTGFNGSGIVTTNVPTTLRLPNSLSGPSYHFPNRVNDAYKEGVHLQTTGDKITVIGAYIKPHSDTFFVIPTIDLGLREYTYYAMSVGGHFSADGSVVMVGTTNHTTLNIIVPTLAYIQINNTINWTSLAPGILHSYEIQRLEIIYIATPGVDITGTKVTASKPISFFSGHECVINAASRRCDVLAEQLPPTRLWGLVYYFAPLAGWSSYKIKVLAAYDSTLVDIYCNNTANSYTIFAGRFLDITYNDQEFCEVRASQEVLVAQFSDYQDSQSMMTLIPSTDHYTDSITSSTPNNYYSLLYNHYINIIVLASYYQPEMMSITTAEGTTQSLNTQSWVPIIANNVTVAYAAQVNISQMEGIFEVTHLNNSALMTVVVYGLAIATESFLSDVFPEGYGHPGWLMGQSNGKFLLFHTRYIRVKGK